MLLAGCAHTGFIGEGCDSHHRCVTGLECQRYGHIQPLTHELEDVYVCVVPDPDDQ